MKIIALIMLTVFALDMIAALYFLHSWLAGVLLLLSVAAVYFLLHQKKTKAAAVGWKLGPALELSNPDRPTPVEMAVITPDIFNLGILRPHYFRINRYSPLVCRCVTILAHTSNVASLRPASSLITSARISSSVFPAIRAAISASTS